MHDTLNPKLIFLYLSLIKNKKSIDEVIYILNNEDFNLNLKKSVQNQNIDRLEEPFTMHGPPQISVESSNN